ncbi:NAD-dependent deacylase [Agaribacterium haliotis]|uniref:NAD-dependent deacylase n=1 Tax=Agaribacterium haliotis TaxID=2013869 RepID=UPI000BB53C68|nr:NAD-dependent deacylase [Agaribacterium haliotis]
MILARDFNNIVVLSGAGLSAESGLRTFRDADGLWEGHRVEDVCTPEAYARDAQTVLRFYNARRTQLKDVKANAAHRALADFQRRHPKKISLVTQNVDDLLERAGASEVIHMHGELLKGLCTACNKRFAWSEAMELSSSCPECGKRGCVRPDIVWFGEVPYHMADIEKRLHNCDLFVAIGTSGQVYPAAGFVSAAAAAGAETVELNLENSQSPWFSEKVSGRACELVPHMFRL